jgi:hypothetical protein
MFKLKIIALRGYLSIKKSVFKYKNIHLGLLYRVFLYTNLVTH